MNGSMEKISANGGTQYNIAPVAPGNPGGYQVFWAVPLERNTQDNAVTSLLDMAMMAGARGYKHIRWPYSRTDIARNSMVEMFLAQSSDPNDVLVMVDNDHIVPPDLIDRLIRHNVGVVGALAFRRGTPYFPCMFVRTDNGAYGVVSSWESGLLEVALVGTGAIAIRRWVFQALDDAGFSWPYFRYQYLPGDKVLPSEDVYFAQSCEKAGIPQYCDTTFCIPHLAVATVDEQSWQQWQEDHPELGRGEMSGEEIMRPGGGQPVGGVA